MYEVVDMVFGFTLQKGDMIANLDDDIITIHRIEELPDGYRICYLDLFEDEEISFEINDNDLVKVYSFFEED